MNMNLLKSFTLITYDYNDTNIIPIAERKRLKIWLEIRATVGTSFHFITAKSDDNKNSTVERSESRYYFISLFYDLLRSLHRSLPWIAVVPYTVCMARNGVKTGWGETRILYSACSLLYFVIDLMNEVNYASETESVPFDLMI